VALPLAYVSDRKGRSLVLLLNIVGLAMMWIAIIFVGWFGDLLPVEAMALAPLLTLIGGGDCVFMSTAASVISDIAPDQRVMTHLFAYTSSVSHVTTLTAPALAALTMSLSLWLPFIIGISLLIMALPLIMVLASQGHPMKSHIESRPDEHSPLLSQTDRPRDLSTGENSSKSLVKRAYNHVSELVNSILNRPKFELLIGIFFLASFGSSNSPLLVQYISKRYGWTFSKAGYLLSAKACVNVLLLTVLIPTFVQIATQKFGLSPRIVNIGAAEISLVISVIGVLTVAASQSIKILIPGNPKLLRQLLSVKIS
jgi:MFS family permease